MTIFLKLKKIKDIIPTYTIIVLIFSILVSVLLCSKFNYCIVKSCSMAPTLNKGDIEIFIRGKWDVFERGEIVSFLHDKELYGKRIIGLPGEKISFLDGYVYINNSRLDEHDYIDADMDTNCAEEFIIPNDCYFVLGDNRIDSDDSRFFDDPFIRKENIVMKHFMTIHKLK